MTTPASPLVVHTHPLSGHSHRVELFLNLIGLPYESRPVDLRAGAHKQPGFLALNAFGQVPVLEEGDTVIADSTAILVYLALRHAPPAWYPRDAVGAAQVQRWLSAASGPLVGGPGRARLIALFGLDEDPAPARRCAEELLRVMEQSLGSGDWFVGSTPTIADVALYSYTAHAPEGGVSLQAFPRVRAWLRRVEALPGFVPMQASRIGLAA